MDCCSDGLVEGVRALTQRFLGTSRSISETEGGRSNLVDNDSKWIDTTEVIEKKGKIPVTGRYCTNRRLRDDYKVASKVLGSGMSGPVQLATSKDGEKCAVKSFKKHGLSDARRTDLKNELSRIQSGAQRASLPLRLGVVAGGMASAMLRDCDFNFQPTSDVLGAFEGEAMFSERRMSVTTFKTSWREHGADDRRPPLPRKRPHENAKAPRRRARDKDEVMTEQMAEEQKPMYDEDGNRTCLRCTLGVTKGRGGTEGRDDGNKNG
ncbi:unnamed protein product [Symbiodinium necroappetens]|nr:unnamed protein product [Symbiodinium necroappetens]